MKRQHVFFFFVGLLIFLYLIRPRHETYSEDVPTVQFPFKNLFHQNGQKLNVILLAAPFRNEEHMQLYEKYKKRGLSFCGISSYLSFPEAIDNPHEDTYHSKEKHDYTKMVSAWLHCFRTPSDKIKKLPHLLLAEADLKDVKSCIPEPGIQKEYDFMYVCLDDNDKCLPGWQSYNRNWELAKKCLPLFAKQGLKGLIIGRLNCDYDEEAHKEMVHKAYLPYHQFIREMQKCRWLFVPNVSDASPRVITEAMCYDIPVLVNSAIFGGWNNVQSGRTGEFFTDETDVLPALEKMKIATYSPRKWYTEHRGKQVSGKALAQFLVQHYPSLNYSDLEVATISI